MAKISKILSHIILIISIIIGAITIFAAYSGHIDPREMSFAPILCMMFPYMIILTLIMIPICLISKKRLIFIPLLTIAACILPILDICPLNIHAKAPLYNDSTSFSLLSYNAHNFIAHDKQFPKDRTNDILSYIIRTNADIVCLQECEYLSPIPAWNVYRPQVDSLKRQYPHIIICDDNGESIFSKYPVKKISSSGYYTHFEIQQSNHKLDIIDVHLRSIRLSDDDKKQYHALADISDSTDIKATAWKNIFSKVANAAKYRARQAQKLREYINTIKNDNIIVCGDFNDVPLCYAIKTISNNEFIDVYAKCGFGPSITYHRDLMYFRIDHILYKGNINATSITCSDFDRSDHYPLFATFKWNKN